MSSSHIINRKPCQCKSEDFIDPIDRVEAQAVQCTSRTNIKPQINDRPETTVEFEIISDHYGIDKRTECCQPDDCLKNRNICTLLENCLRERCKNSKFEERSNRASMGPSRKSCQSRGTFFEDEPSLQNRRSTSVRKSRASELHRESIGMPKEKSIDYVLDRESNATIANRESMRDMPNRDSMATMSNRESIATSRKSAGKSSFDKYIDEYMDNGSFARTSCLSNVGSIASMSNRESGTTMPKTGSTTTRKTIESGKRTSVFPTRESMNQSVFDSYSNGRDSEAAMENDRIYCCQPESCFLPHKVCSPNERCLQDYRCEVHTNEYNRESTTKSRKSYQSNRKTLQDDCDELLSVQTTKDSVRPSILHMQNNQSRQSNLSKSIKFSNLPFPGQPEIELDNISLSPDEEDSLTHPDPKRSIRFVR